jgi:hypothetical protein
MIDKHPAGVPTEQELDELLGDSAFGGECSVLCADLLSAIDELRGTTGIARVRIMARIRAIRSRMKELKCGLCLPS